MNKKIISFLGIIFTITCICTASTITVEAGNVGWYREGGYHYQAPNIIVGVDQPTTLSENYYGYASYLVFSIPKLTNEITAISFSLELVRYCSEDISETIRISGVSTPVETLMASHTGADLRPSIYNDLINGPELGVMEVNLGHLYPFGYLTVIQEKGPVFSASLNETGVRLIEDAVGSQFTLGLSMTSTQGDREEYIVSDPWSGDPDYWVAQLQITTVPEPATMLLLVAGMVFTRAGRFRKRSPFLDRHGSDVST